MPEVSMVRTRRAAKAHECCECREPIQIGDEYEHVQGKWDGRWDSFKTCQTCVRIRSDFCECFIYGGLRDALWDCLGVDYVTGAIAEWGEDAE